MRFSFVSSLVSLSLFSLAGCGGDAFVPPNGQAGQSGSAGQSGNAGQGGNAGSAGSAGQPGGSAGASGQGGSASGASGQGGSASGQGGSAGAQAGGGQGGSAGAAGGGIVGTPCELGTFKCVDNLLFGCDLKTHTRDFIQNCAENGVCNEKDGKCGLCAPGTILGCESDKFLKVCDTNGESTKGQACPSDGYCTPVGDDEGNCVACLKDEHCPLPGVPCKKAVCMEGACVNQPIEGCNECLPGTSVACNDEKSKLVCDDDGSTKNVEGCGVDKPYCVNDGNCVQCRTAADCSLPPDTECAVPDCVDSVCKSKNLDKGTLLAKQPADGCTTRTCDGQGSVTETSPLKVIQRKENLSA